MLALGRSDQRVYRHAIERAAQLLLLALSDHANPDVSVRLLEALCQRVDADKRRHFPPDDVRVVFNDIRRRAVVLLAEELRQAPIGTSADKEIRRRLLHLLSSVENLFRPRTARRHHLSRVTLNVQPRKTIC